MKIELDLTDDELIALWYGVGELASPYAADPFKNIYELGMSDDEDRAVNNALASLDKKIAAVAPSIRAIVDARAAAWRKKIG